MAIEWCAIIHQNYLSPRDIKKKQKIFFQKKKLKILFLHLIAEIDF